MVVIIVISSTSSSNKTKHLLLFLDVVRMQIYSGQKKGNKLLPLLGHKFISLVPVFLGTHQLSQQLPNPVPTLSTTLEFKVGSEVLTVHPAGSELATQKSVPPRNPGRDLDGENHPGTPAHLTEKRGFCSLAETERPTLQGFSPLGS